MLAKKNFSWRGELVEPKSYIICRFFDHLLRANASVSVHCHTYILVFYLLAPLSLIAPTAAAAARAPLL